MLALPTQHLPITSHRQRSLYKLNQIYLSTRHSQPFHGHPQTPQPRRRLLLPLCTLHQDPWQQTTPVLNNNSGRSISHCKHKGNLSSHNPDRFRRQAQLQHLCRLTARTMRAPQLTAAYLETLLYRPLASMPKFSGQNSRPTMEHRTHQLQMGRLYRRHCPKAGFRISTKTRDSTITFTWLPNPLSGSFPRVRRH